MFLVKFLKPLIYPSIVRLDYNSIDFMYGLVAPEMRTKFAQAY